MTHPQIRSCRSEKRSILIGLVVLLGLALAGAGSSLVEAKQRRSGAAPSTATGTIARISPARLERLQAELERAGRAEPGKVGIIVKSLDEGWSAGFRGASIFPQGSLRRLWLGAAALAALDEGELESSENLSGVSRPNSPTVLKRSELDRLLVQSVGQDDPLAQDALLQVLGGPERVEALFAAKQLDEIAFGPSNAELRKLLWQASLSGAELNGDGGNGGLSTYLASPVDAATPEGFAQALADLAAGRLISASSTDLLLGQLAALHGPVPQVSLPAGWRLRTLSGRAALENGIPLSAASAGLLVSPQGERCAFAIFAADGDRSDAATERLVRKTIGALSNAHS